MTLLLLLLLLLDLGASAARAADGSLDPTFGSGGRVTRAIGPTGVMDGALAVVVQPDGKVVAAGHVGWAGLSAGSFAVARFTPDGSPDPTFGGTGKVLTSVPGSGHADAVTLQPDGKIVAAGYSGNSAFTLIRYQSNGSLDPTFGAAGVAHTDLPTGAAKGVAVLSDGRILVAGGLTRGAGLTYDAALARFQADGTLDPTFGSGGTVVTDLGFGEFFDSLAVAPDETVYYTGGEWYRPGPGRYGYDIDFVVARYLADGTLDPSFGNAGLAVTDFATEYSDYEFVAAIALQTDGKVVATGPVGSFAGVARYLPDGSLDPSFGTGGREVLTQFGPGMNPRGIAIEPDGRIVVAGTAARGLEGDFGFAGNPFEFALTRLHPDGSLDSTFAPCPQVTTSFPGAEVFGWALARAPDGKYVIAGETTAADSNFALARYGTSAPSVCDTAPARQSSARLHHAASDVDTFAWRWASPSLPSAADLGDPTTEASYTLCVLEDTTATPHVVLGGPLLRVGWSGTGTKFRMKRTGESDSPVVRVRLRANGPGRGKLMVKAKGEHLAPGLPLATPVTVRLTRDDAPSCWEATFDAGVKRNDATAFAGRSD